MSYYELEISRERQFLEASELNDWESIICSKEPGHQRAGSRITPLSIDILTRNVVDFSRTMLSDIVVTDRALNVFRNAGLTGFVVNSVDVATPVARIIDAASTGLWELLVVGKAGPAHVDSGIKKIGECGECGLIEYSSFTNGICVNPSTYDGSDFFVVIEYPKHVLVSDRAKKVIEDARLTNAAFIESTKLRWPKGVIERA